MTTTARCEAIRGDMSNRSHRSKISFSVLHHNSNRCGSPIPSFSCSLLRDQMSRNSPIIELSCAICNFVLSVVQQHPVHAAMSHTTLTLSTATHVCKRGESKSQREVGAVLGVLPTSQLPLSPHTTSASRKPFLACECGPKAT